jgi:hypothetical protein
LITKLRSRLSYANVVASLALFLALTGGTALALSGSNTVFSDDIVDGQVKKPDLADGSVGSKQLTDGSVAGVDLSPRAGRIHSGRVVLTGGVEGKTGPIVDVPGFGELGGTCRVNDPSSPTIRAETDFQNSSGGPLEVLVDTGPQVQEKVLAAGGSFGSVGSPLPGRVIWQIGRGSGAQTRLMTVTATVKGTHPDGNPAAASCLFQAQALAQSP